MLSSCKLSNDVERMGFKRCRLRRGVFDEYRRELSGLLSSYERDWYRQLLLSGEFRDVQVGIGAPKDGGEQEAEG
jgi:hypothetical protein